MSADFWAGYVSGAIGILVGNPLDIIKTKLQAGSAKKSPEITINPGTQSQTSAQRWTSFARGAAAPILGYGALNGNPSPSSNPHASQTDQSSAILFVTYNRSLSLLQTGSLSTLPQDLPSHPPAWSIWTAGALGGLATFIISAPTELVKCRAQISNPPRSSWQITQELFKTSGIRGLYTGGTITSLRDSIGYGFYFYSYELTKRSWTSPSDSESTQAFKVLMCGGLAGVVTWASIFPLDVIKTRVQIWDLSTAKTGETEGLLGSSEALAKRPSTLAIARSAYQAEGIPVFFRGLGVCSARAFIVNAVQWAVYEWMMKVLTKAT
ncbi:Solute carrier family 25 member 45 [Pseudocercospora fuligena]|uniref:Solute carrier family 25 member 45 n=1 Tax=Pseudocercospora fuligena TaxID=685502 RepID=A0A8H6VG20_9PEZI|nr:Solute carrier family 25 member 45 [Pseudocercospora fuligena]